MTHTPKEQQFALDYVLRKHADATDILGEAALNGGVGAAIGAPIGAAGGALMDDTPDRNMLTKILMGGLRGAGVGAAMGGVRGGVKGYMNSQPAPSSPSDALNAALQRYETEKGLGATEMPVR